MTSRLPPDRQWNDPKADFDNDVRWLKNLLTCVFMAGLIVGTVAGAIIGRFTR